MVALRYSGGDTRPPSLRAVVGPVNSSADGGYTMVAPSRTSSSLIQPRLCSFDYCNCNFCVPPSVPDSSEFVCTLFTPTL